MKQFISIILAVIAANMFFVWPAYADPDDLLAEFESDPLFGEANFLPGDDVTRFAKVTNNTSDTKKIAVEAINVSDPDGLGDVLNLKITEGPTELYNDTLSQFFADGETFLSELAGGGTQTQYDFTVSFDELSGDSYQEKSLGFDILIGFQGEGGGINAAANGSGGGGGGGGSGLAQGLVIKNEAAVEIDAASVTIEWLTSFFATSQVIYSAEGEPHTLDLTDTSDTPPKYGYAHTTAELDTSPRVTFHSVTITGLTPGTTYFYRTVSHASPATISREFSFTTKSLPKERIPSPAPVPVGEEGLLPIAQLPPPIAGEPLSPEIALPGEEVSKVRQKEGEVTPLEEVLDEEESAVEATAQPLGGLGAFLGGLRELDRFELLLILILAILIGWLILRWWKFQGKERGQRRQRKL